ncbi:hypothetical protein, partial [Streptomyces sp. NPDC055094]
MAGVLAEGRAVLGHVVDAAPSARRGAGRHGPPGLSQQALGPVRSIFVGPERLARRLAALSESAKYVQYEADP